MNKKGTIIPLETLLGILIALLVFGTLWWGISKFLRLSGQAEDNFYDLADKIKEVNKPDGETPQTFISIQDKETFLVLLQQTSSPVLLDRDTQDYSFAYPQEQCGGETCLCLCQKYEKTNPVQCPQLSCQNLLGVQITGEWINVRLPANLRRVPLQIENVDGRIRITGGNEPYIRPTYLDVQPT